MQPVAPSAYFPYVHIVGPIVISLFEMEPRIKVYSLFGDADPEMNQGYIPEKHQLLFPIGIPGAAHEIAHMVEMRNPDRWTKVDWGMVSPKKNKGYSKWQSTGGLFAALTREIRVRAIQQHINSEMPYPSIMDNPHWNDLVCDRLHFGRFKSRKDVLDWSNDLKNKTYNAWSLDRIRHEWEVRLNHIRNWMETN